MTKLCPRCRLPMAALGRAVAATSDDGMRSGVVGICRRCTNQETHLPKSLYIKRLQPALERALSDPDPYLCTIYPDIGAAVLATAMIGHPDFATRALVALGWMPEDLN